MFRSLRDWPATFRALRSSQVHARPWRRARRRFSPQCPPQEQLEDRRLLSTIMVNNPTDTPVAGEIDLRQAIATANSNSAPTNTISFAAALAGQTITLTSGEQLDVTKSLTIVGSSETISGDNLSRVFAFKSGTDQISGLTIADGNPSSGNGGGLDNSATLTVRNIIFTSNFATDGGGLANESGGKATVLGSTFTSSSAGDAGGGLANGGTASVSGSTFTSNFAGDAGGGLYNDGTATVSGSTFTRNSASSDGGGLANFGTATVSGSTFTSNSASFDGGGIDNFGSLTQTGNTFTGNSPNNIGP